MIIWIWKIIEIIIIIRERPYGLIMEKDKKRMEVLKIDYLDLKYDVNVNNNNKRETIWSHHEKRINKG